MSETGNGADEPGLVRGEPAVVVLSEPLQAHGETVDRLTLRWPRGEDIQACGMPFRFNSETGEVTMNTASIAAYIVRLGGVPRSTVNRMAAADFVVASNRVMGFFNPPAPTRSPSTDTSTSRGSGTSPPPPSSG